VEGLAFRRRVLAAAAGVGLAVALLSLLSGDGAGPFHGQRGTAPVRAARHGTPWWERLARLAASRQAARGLAPVGTEASVLRHFVRLGLPIFCGGGRGRYVALTFDDGPGPNTAATLRLLRAAHARATFFLVGRQLEDWPRLPRQMLAQGAVGDHTWSHPFLPRLARRALRNEVVAGREAVDAATGAPVTLFRPPYGAHDVRLDTLLGRIGLLEVLWNVDTRDSERAPRKAIIANARDGLRPGNIVLMHEIHTPTIQALRPILRSVRRRRLRAVSVPELLALDPPSDAQVRAGSDACMHRGRHARR
jgi:peptidoglycan/xylan/chitin deacetylase (PgdA/CDA1 family)